jgi:hypothetical protein
VLRRFVRDGVLAESAEPAGGRARRRAAALLPPDRLRAARGRGRGARMEKALAMARSKNLVRKPRLA